MSGGGATTERGKGTADRLTSDVDVHRGVKVFKVAVGVRAAIRPRVSRSGAPDFQLAAAARQRRRAQRRAGPAQRCVAVAAEAERRACRQSRLGPVPHELRVQSKGRPRDV